MKDLISITDLTVEELQELIDKALDIIECPDKYAEKCKRKKLATLFFEPSTRTRLSFEAAMLELGGSVLGFSEANSSSAAKGETVSVTGEKGDFYIVRANGKDGYAAKAYFRLTGSSGSSGSSGPVSEADRSDVWM